MDRARAKTRTKI